MSVSTPSYYDVLQVSRTAAQSEIRSAYRRVAPPDPPSPGSADAVTTRSRVGALFPAGSRITDVRYGGGIVTIVGEAGSNRSVSDGLRAIAGQGSTPELLQTQAMPGGCVRFEVMLRRSALVTE